MTVKDNYQLKFISHEQRCRTTVSEYYILAYIISRLDSFEAKSLLWQLQHCIVNKFNGNISYESDTFEDLQFGILYEYPNVNLDNVLLIPMSDLESIVEDWLEFIKKEQNR